MSDAQIWNALELVHLTDLVKSLNGKLDSLVSDKGSNLSNGERQLICIARSYLMKQAPILILDEASSSSDVKTDQLIQQSLRTLFGKKTIITIAHRLDTVIDYDNIAVIIQGKIVEFGSSEKLLTEHPDGEFSKLLKASGTSNSTI